MPEKGLFVLEAYAWRRIESVGTLTGRLNPARSRFSGTWVSTDKKEKQQVSLSLEAVYVKEVSDGGKLLSTFSAKYPVFVPTKVNSPNKLYWNGKIAEKISNDRKYHMTARPEDIHEDLDSMGIKATWPTSQGLVVCLRPRRLAQVVGARSFPLVPALKRGLCALFKG